MQDDNSIVSAGRQKVRESIFFGATLTFSGSGDIVPVRVRNISTGGMMVDCTIATVIGEEVLAEIKNVGTVKGRVAWSVAPRMGIAFDREINPAKARLKI